MKQILTFILLLCHINTSLLLPQVAEVDIYDANGKQVNDVNSVVEYISEVILHHKDDNPQDEDDDSGQNLHLVKSVVYYYRQQSVLLHHIAFNEVDVEHFSIYRINKVNPVSYDIIVPPPKA